MVRQTKMFVSSQGVAFDMHGPPAPCTYCGGLHREHSRQMNGQGVQQQEGKPQCVVDMAQMNPMQMGGGGAWRPDGRGGAGNGAAVPHTPIRPILCSQHMTSIYKELGA